MRKYIPVQPIGTQLIVSVDYDGHHPYVPGDTLIVDRYFVIGKDSGFYCAEGEAWRWDEVLLEPSTGFIPFPSRRNKNV